MKHHRNLVNESQSLTVFEMLNKLQDFLHEKHGIKAFGAKEDNGFVMFMSSYVTDEEGLHDKDLSEAIQKFVEKEFADLKPVVVHKDNYGYHIEFGENKQAAKLVEVTQAQGTGMADAKVSYKCHFCGKMEEGYGNDPWPLDTNPTHRVCEKCNNEVVIPARIEKLTQKESKNENVDQRDVEASASNIVLDDKYTWLFSVLDENGRDVAEGIEYLQEAIDVLVRESAAFLVAFPYVDPKPDDPDVEFVFADNPGPVIIYNNEEVTLDKADLERPTSDTQPKPEEDGEESDEEVVEEKIKSPYILVYTGHEGMSGPLYKDMDDEIYFQDINGQPPYSERAHIAILSPKNEIDGDPDYTLNKEEYFFAEKSLEENVHAGMSEEKLDIYLMNAVDVIQELTGLDKTSIENEIIGTHGTLKVQLLNAMEYVQELTGEKMADIENMLGCPVNTYVQLATDNSELKTEDTEETLEEFYTKGDAEDMINEGWGDDKFIVTVDANREWYDRMDEQGIALPDAFRGLVDEIEETLDYQANIFLSFDYVGQRSHDLESNPTDLKEAQEAEEVLADFFGTSANVNVIRRPF